jgi:hypothetical protein
MVREKKFDRLLQVRLSKTIHYNLQMLASRTGIAIADATRLCLSAGLVDMQKIIPSDETKRSEQP